MAGILRRLVLLILLSPGAALAQPSEQFWIDYSADYPFANKYLAEVEAGYQTLLSDQDKWNAFSLTPDFEVNINPHLDLMGQLLLGYTNQTSTYNSFETRPIFIAKYYFTPGKRVDARLSLKYEHRMFHELDIDNWIISNRFRIHGEVLLPINRQNIFQDKMWYGILEGEAFYNIDRTVKERFASVLLLRAGIGYRLSYSYRFELFAFSMTTQDVLTGEDISQQNILRIRIKHFLHQAKPTLQNSK